MTPTQVSLESNKFFKLGILKALQSFAFNNLVLMDLCKRFLCNFLCDELKIPFTSFIILIISSPLLWFSIQLKFKRFLVFYSLCSMSLHKCSPFVSHWRMTFPVKVLLKNDPTRRAELRPLSGLLFFTHTHTQIVVGLKLCTQNPVSPHLLVYKCLGTACWVRVLTAMTCVLLLVRIRRTSDRSSYVVNQCWISGRLPPWSENWDLLMLLCNSLRNF